MIYGNMCIKIPVCGQEAVCIAEYSCRNDGGVSFWRACPTGNSGMGVHAIIGKPSEDRSIERKL